MLEEPGTETWSQQRVEATFTPVRRISGLHEMIQSALRVADTCSTLIVAVSSPLGVQLVSDEERNVTVADNAWRDVRDEIHALGVLSRASVILAETLNEYGFRNVNGWYPAIRKNVEILCTTPVRRFEFEKDVELALMLADDLISNFTGNEGNAVLGIDFDNTLAEFNGKIVDFYEKVRPWQTDTIDSFANAVQLVRTQFPGAA